jgi:hypothetical protein
MSEVLFVSRGRTLMQDGTSHGPGAMVTLPADEAARMQDLGFVQSETPILTPPTGPNPASVGLQNQNIQGPSYRR